MSIFFKEVWSCSVLVAIQRLKTSQPGFVGTPRRALLLDGRGHTAGAHGDAPSASAEALPGRWGRESFQETPAVVS